MVARHRQRLVGGDLAGAELHQVTDQPQVRLRTEDPLLLRDVFLEDVGLQGAIERRDVGALPFRCHQVHAEDGDGGAGDGHRRGDPAQIDTVEEHVHVGGRVDRHPAVPDLAERTGVVRIASHQGRHVERHRQSPAALGEDRPVPLVGLPGVAETGELTDGPGLPAIAGGVQPAGEGKFAGPADPVEPLHKIPLGRAVHGIQRFSRQRAEVGIPHPAGLLGGVEAGLPAAAPVGDAGAVEGYLGARHPPPPSPAPGPAPVRDPGRRAGYPTIGTPTIARRGADPHRRPPGRPDQGSGRRAGALRSMP